MPGSLMFYPTTDEHLVKLKKDYPEASDINSLADFIMQNRNNIKFRFQDRRSIFYTNKEQATKLVDRFWDFWIGSETVDPKFADLDKNTVGCTRLPHGKYQYQVYLKKDAHLFVNDTQKTNLWHFLERNVDNCLISNEGVLDWFEGKCPYCFGGYFYVKEEKYLTPIYMMAQNAIDKVIKFRKVKNGSNKKATR